MTAPWEHGRTPLARAFSAALNRTEAINHDGTDTAFAGVNDHALMVSGLDADPTELRLYVEALTGAYVAEIAESDDASDEHAVMLLRGLTTTAWLAGRLGDRRDASAGSTPAVPLADPGDVTSEGNTLAEQHRRARIELYERHKRERELELGADQAADGALDFGMPLRAVLELEAERFERMGAELLRWMPGPLWELYDSAARELREMLEGTQP